MNINLAPKDEEYIKSKVDDGYYLNLDDAIRDAVRRMREADEEYDPFVEAVMKGAREVEEGKMVRYTSDLMEQIRQNAIQRAARNEKPSPDVIPQ